MRACIERVTHDRVGGWAVNDNDLNERLTINLLLDEEIIAETIADNNRDDLRRNGVGDGLYGYLFHEVARPTLPADYLSGRVQVRAVSRNGATIFASAAHYLQQHIKFNLQIQRLESSTFSDFLAYVSEESPTDPKSAGHLSDLLNASRAHFPEWLSSGEFLHLSIDFAKKAGRTLTERYYEDRLRQLLNPRAEPTKTYEPVLDNSLPASYGSLREWSEIQDGISIAIVRPRFFVGENPQSFLQEVGILTDSPMDIPKVKVLAFREYAWGAPSWSVKRRGIPTDVARNLYYLDFEMIRNVLHQGGFIVIDMTNEGPIPDPNFIALWNSALRELELNPKQVILVTQNLRFAGVKADPRFAGHVTTGHFYISKALIELKTEYSSDERMAMHCATILTARKNAPPAALKPYICMNFTPRWSRWATALYLSWKGYLDKGFVSFPGGANSKMRNALRLDEWFPDIRHRTELLRHAPSFMQRCPLELDIKASAIDSPDFVYPLELTTNSLVHIVTESEMTDGSVVRITEKILKPIVGLQPFIVIGNPGSLELLRHLGFKTFSPLIDESYDSISNVARRMDATFDQIDRLMEVPEDTLRAKVDGLTETLIHNFLHLMTAGPALFNNATRHRLLKLMAANVREPNC